MVLIDLFCKKNQENPKLFELLCAKIILVCLVLLLPSPTQCASTQIRMKFASMEPKIS